MNIEDPHFEEYEQRFRALAEDIGLHKGPLPELASARQYLFLYGENGLEPDQELETLAGFETEPINLRGIEVQTGYWEDLVIFLPG